MSKGPGQSIDDLDARRLRIAIVASRFNASIVDLMLAGAESEFLRCGGEKDRLHVVRVPGAFELPVVAAALARTEDFDAILALGCLIKGETVHDRVIADAVAQGLVQIGIDTGIPVLFGVLTVDTFEQAKARAEGGRSGKGAECMAAAIETVAALDALRQSV